MAIIMAASMGRRAVAVHTLVIVIMMGLFAVVAFFLFYQFSGQTNIQATSATCGFKKIFYCQDWKANGYVSQPWDWNGRPPIGCGSLNPPIRQPNSREDCEGVS